MRNRIRDVIVPLVVGVPITAVSVVVVVLTTSGPRMVGLLAGVVLAQIAWFAVRWRPLPAFGLTCVAFAIQAVASGLFLTVPSVVVFPVVVAGVCARGRRGLVPLVLAGGVAGAVVAAWRFTADPMVRATGLQPSPVAVTVALVAVVAAAASLGLLRRTHLANLALLAERARLAEADRDAAHARAVRDERQRIAREMHDVVSHSLSVIVNLARGGQFAIGDVRRSSELLTTIEETGRQALTDMRGLLGVLRPDPGQDPDANDRAGALAPQPTLRQLPELVDRTRAAGLAVELQVSGTPWTPSPAAELAAYRVVQESLTNVVKHAAPTSGVTVALAWAAGGLTIRIHNGPTPDDPGADRPEPVGGHGLIGMRERLLAVGGSLRAAPEPQGGFTVLVEIPRSPTPDSITVTRRDDP